MTGSIHIRLEQFEGPLSLLLELIEQKKLSINEISLASITDQYIEVIKAADAIDPESLADFLVVATKLLQRKARTLAPFEFSDEEEEGNLEHQLKIYKEFLEAAHVIAAILRKKNIAFSRKVERVPSLRYFFPPESLTPAKLQEWMNTFLSSLEPFIVLPSQAFFRAVTLQEKMEQLRKHLQSKQTILFHSLVSDSSSPLDIILTFLALLELSKQRKVRMEQQSLFADIIIEPSQNG